MSPTVHKHEMIEMITFDDAVLCHPNHDCAKDDGDHFHDHNGDDNDDDNDE